MQFVAAFLINNPRLVVDEEEVEMINLDCEFSEVPPSKEVKGFYLDSGFSIRPSLSCDGLICMPVPGWINVLNPSTGEYLRFSSGRDPKITNVSCDISSRGFEVFPGYWRMGFGRDKVNGRYKVVRMFFEPNYYCEILDVNIGVWRKLKSKPLFYVGERLKSAFVDGSIYWLEIKSYHQTQKILGLDLHTEEFRSVKTPPRFCKSGQIANLEDRLVVAAADMDVDIQGPHFKFNIWSMDAQEETWTITYSFPLSSSTRNVYWGHWWHWCMPLAVSKRGNLYFYDQEKKLHKYYSDTGLVHGKTHGGVRIVAPFVENLLPIRSSASSGQKTRTFGFRNLDKPENCFRQVILPVLDVLRNEWPEITITTAAVVALLVFLK